MNAADLPYLVLLVGPGFIAMQFRAWASEDYRLSDIQRLVWSSLASAVLFFAWHGILRHFPWKVGSIASPEALLAEPASVPFQFLIALYFVAGAGGLVLGKLQDAGATKRLLAGIGLDPDRNRDVWKAAFRRSRLMTVFLSKGVVYRGWAEESSTALNDDRRFVLLDKAILWNKSKKTWDPSTALFVLIRLEEISRIEFLNRPQDKSKVRGYFVRALRFVKLGPRNSKGESTAPPA